MPSEDHLTPFLEAMHEGDVQRASAHLSETAELNSPILPTPFKPPSSLNCSPRLTPSSRG